MRPRQQQGQVTRRGANWVLRFHEDRLINGKIKRVRTMQPLGLYSDFPRKVNKYNEEARVFFQSRINEILAGVNGPASGVVEGTLTVGDFIERRYFPRLDERLKIPAGNELHIEPSTIKSYKDIWKTHVQPHHVSAIQVRHFGTENGRKFLESLPQSLSHQTHLRIKNFLKGVFTWAIASGAIKGVNPMDATKAGGRTKPSDPAMLTVREQKIQASREHKYSLEEVAAMLEKLPEPARTVCAVAAFTGLSRSELSGLKWSDYDGVTLKIQRKIWNGQVGSLKTEAREAGIYVMPILRKILAKYRKEFPSNGEGWIFRGERLGRPLNLDNLSRKVIPQFINGAWFGWHSFRRGLATRLYEAGVSDKDIQHILRHADISTTQAYYILPSQAKIVAGMRRLDKVVKAKYNIRS